MNRERGIAAITAILIVAVAATAATLMLAQQSEMLDQTMLVTSRAQADMYASAGLDWARGTLLEDSRASGAFDSLGEAWAQPIVGLPIERAVVSGVITDEQGKFNLNNLVAANGAKSLKDVEIFQQLLSSLGLPPELADAVLDWIDVDDAASTTGAEDAYYLSLKRPYRAANRSMVQVEELYRVRGFDAATVAKLRPFVTALPERTSVNVNTASEALLDVVLPLPRESVALLVKQRLARPFVSTQALAQWAKATIPEDLVNVKSSYFSVLVRVAQDDVELATDALVSRPGQGGPPVIIWRRPRY